jgi:pantoate--beta-alanine ligase
MTRLTVATPTVVTSAPELRANVARMRAAGQSVAVVMTMGALHEGHRSLMRRARELADAVVVTIFVNPLQFGPTEDLDRYPRTLDADLGAAAAERVDLVFAPDAREVYPEEPLVRVSAGPLGGILEGASRPGHFDGVLTVVAKLLHLVGPDVAVFGQKDAQQLAAIRRMVLDLHFPVTVIGAPTVREPDGLAMSSRNRFLSAADRAAALALSRALVAGEGAAAQGPHAVRAAAQAVLDAEPGVALDYLALVTESTLEELPESGGDALLLVAARVGTTRLIDNIPLTVASAPRV